MELGSTGTSVYVAQVSAGLFPLLGVMPTLGRGFTSEDERDLESRSVLISDGLWRQAFGAAPDIVGQQVDLGGRAHTVIGVMPPEARYPIGRAVSAWVPLTGYIDPRDPSSAYVGVVALLRRGLTPESAQPALDAAARAIQAAQPDGRPWSATLVRIDSVHSQAPALVLMVFGAVMFVLLAACANLANLLLARASTRQREIAVRSALGASRLRLARLLASESLVLGVCGGIAAWLPAQWLIQAVPSLLPPRLIPFVLFEPALDWRVMIFGIVTSLLVGVISGLLPAVRASDQRIPGSQGLSAGLSIQRAQYRPIRRLLLSLQVAFAMLLLTGAGLLTASFARMVTSDPGYALDGLYEVSVRLPHEQYPQASQTTFFFESWVAAVGALPEVTSATIGTPPPTTPSTSLAPQGAEDVPDTQPRTLTLVGDADYLRTVGIHIIRGRPFSAEHYHPDTRVVVVDEEAARRFWPLDDPIGKRVRLGRPEREWLTVVGVARDIKTAAVGNARDSLEAYVPVNRQRRSLGGTLMFRTSGDPAAVFATARAQAQAIEPDVRFVSAGTVEDLYGPAFANPRFTALIMSLFAALALLTGAVGLYGMLSYDVAARIPEIGIRMALGADATDVRRSVTLDALWPVGAGLATGAILAQALVRVIGWRLYQVSPHDSGTLAAVSGIFIAVALVAAYGPVRRATRVDPIVALRHE